jgi:hypothetical protein
LNSIYVHWLAPNDYYVVSGGHIEVQWQKSGDTTWTSHGKVDPSINYAWILNVSDGVTYNVQLRAVNSAGVPSEWVSAGSVTVGTSLSLNSYNGSPVAPSGTLTAQALYPGNAQISISSFTATVGLATAACTPSPNVITGLNQSQLYEVYYVDPTFAGGTITPIAIQTPSAYLGHTGYFLIGSVTTPSYTPRYHPSRYSDIGSSTTSYPAAAYDNDVTTDAAVVSSLSPYVATTYGNGAPSSWGFNIATGDCVWTGFPAVVTGSTTNLHVLVASTSGGDVGNAVTYSANVSVKIGSNVAPVTSFTTATGTADYTYAIPTGTDLSTVSVEGTVSISTPSSNASPYAGAATLEGFEIYIQ